MKDCKTSWSQQEAARGWRSDVISKECNAAVLRKEPTHIHHRRPNGDGSVGDNGAVEACRVSDRGRATNAEEDVTSPRVILEQDLRPHCGRETAADLKEELAGRVSLGVKREYAVQFGRRRELVHAGRERLAAERHARQDLRRRHAHARAVCGVRVALALHRSRCVDFDRTGDTWWETGYRTTGRQADRSMDDGVARVGDRRGCAYAEVACRRAKGQCEADGQCLCHRCRDQKPTYIMKWLGHCYVDVVRERCRNHGRLERAEVRCWIGLRWRISSWICGTVS